MSAFTFALVQLLKFFFLFLQFLDYGLHGSGHKYRGIIGTRSGFITFTRFAHLWIVTASHANDYAADNSEHQNEERNSSND